MSEKITINKIDALCNVGKHRIVDIGAVSGEKICVKIKIYLSVEEEQDLINRVTSAVIGEDGYFSSLLEPVFTAIVLQTMTNIGIPTKKGTKEGERIFDFNKIQDWMYSSDLQKIFVEAGVSEYINALHLNVEKSIEYKKQQILNKTPLNDFIAKLSNVFDSYQEAYGNNFSGLINPTNISTILPNLEETTKATILEVPEQLRFE